MALQDFDETFEKDELNEDDPKGEDLDVFLLAKLVELAGIIGATGWWVLVWVIKHILLYTLYEEVHILKDKLLYWRNETYEYFMSWPQINFTVAGIYDLLNLYYNWQLDVPINQNLKVLRLINRWKSNITLRAFGQEVNQFLFPPEKGGILDGLYVNGSWVQLWFNAGLNRTWGLPFIFHSQERLPFTGDTNHVSAMWSSYERFLRLFDLQYSLIEKLSRFRIFMKNLMMIIRLNAQEQGSAGYGFTHFAALSQEEFMMKYTSHIPTYTGETYYSNDDIVSSFTTTPAEFDWRSKQVVSGVKNQKYCTGSWAYAVVDCLEAHNAIRQGSLVELSTQQIIDCDKNSKGCKGGSVTNAYQYLYHAGGLAPASAYAYTGRQGNCSFKPKMAVVKVRNTFHSLPQREETMRQFIYNYGPTVATLNAAQLQFYKRGIIRCDNHLCDSTLTNHAVTIVGYGIERGYIDSYVGNNSQSGNPYWLIKNSWGPAWGEKGYFRLFRGENTLGIQNFVTAPVVVPEDT